MAIDTANVGADPRGGNQRRDRPLIGRWRFEADDLEELRAALDWPHARTRRADEAEEALAAEALHVGRSHWTSYSRRKEWYARATRYQLPHRLGYRPVINAVGSLDGLGLIDHDRKKPSSRSLGYQSRFRASARLMAAATECPPLLRCGPPRAPLILRDEDGHANRFCQTAWTRAIARNIAEIEELIASICADLDPDTPCRWRCGDLLEIADRHGEPFSIHVGHVPLCRIFNRDWQCGGRFIGPPCQGWPRRIRAHLTLDGAPTAELDYGATHLRMLLADAGLDVETGDLFDLPGFERDLVKRTIYITINAPTLKSALLAASDERPRRKGTRAKAAAIITAIKEKFPALIPYLHQGAGLQLMRRESDIAECVLLARAPFPRYAGVAQIPFPREAADRAKLAAQTGTRQAPPVFD